MKSFAAEAKAYGGPVILIPFSEMNGNWFPWSGTLNGNTPAKMIQSYRHIHDLFVGAPNVKFGFAPNNGSVPDTAANSIQSYYPGDAYVDYVGVDGFNFGAPWETFDQVFGKSLNILSVYNKPIYIFSMASADGPNKAAWITDAFTVQIPKYKNIAGFIWFNENKERDWRVNSDPNSLAAFKAIVP
jgi:endoglucanase